LLVPATGNPGGDEGAVPPERAAADRVRSHGRPRGGSALRRCAHGDRAGRRAASRRRGRLSPRPPQRPAAAGQRLLRLALSGRGRGQGPRPRARRHSAGAWSAALGRAAQPWTAEARVDRRAATAPLENRERRRASNDIATKLSCFRTAAKQGATTAGLSGIWG